ncbi:MAG: hypothetical protein WBZ37_31360 [Mycobacterium sp.]
MTVREEDTYRPPRRVERRVRPTGFRPDIEGLRAVALFAVNAGGIDAEQAPTTADRCPTVVGNTLVFRDDNHVTTEHARLRAPLSARRPIALWAAAEPQ